MFNLCEMLDQHETARPRHAALISGDYALDYAELAQQVRCYAAALAADGVACGDRVGVALRDSVDHVVLLFALMRLGAVIVPLDWRWTDSEIQSLVQHFAVGSVLFDDPERSAGSARSQCIDALWRQRAADLEAPAPLAQADDLPLLLSLSSGTTGRPTGPLLSHAQFDARLQNQLATLTFNQHDRYLLATPLYFGGGRAFVLAHLLFGATVIMKSPPYTPAELVAEVAKQRASSLFLVPTLIRRLLELDDQALAGMRSLRLLVSSGAPLYAFERLAVRQRITEGLFEYYASTEGGGISVLSPTDQQQHPDSVGRAAYRVELQIVDELHRPLPTGRVGRIRYRGPGVADSFYQDPEATAVSFHAGWFYPGDLGRLDEEGFLYLMGRSKDVVIRGGVNIYPLEIERLLGAAPAVSEVVVVGLVDPEFGEKLVAVVVPQAGMSIDSQALKDYCRGRLARYKQPSEIVTVKELPKNSAGKVLKTKLAAMLAQR